VSGGAESPHRWVSRPSTGEHSEIRTMFLCNHVVGLEVIAPVYECVKGGILKIPVHRPYIGSVLSLL
jgi:hypothetical protein